MAAPHLVRPLAPSAPRSRFADPGEAAFLGMLVAASHALQRLDAVCHEHGITHTQYGVLKVLRRAQPEGLPRFAIAERLVARAPDVTRLLDRLEQQGLVARGWAPRNRRHSVARIAGPGLDLLEALDPKVRDLQSAVLAPLSHGQVLQLADAFDTLLSS
jgi:DNA-binding MarR family transcriptional regulator